ncbi:MAG: hypothetical protein WCE45_05345 [Sedimentisphaerales bacterium]
MDREIFQHLVELSQSFAKIGLTPVICGGLGIYLSFHKNTEEVVRATNDTDLILTKTQILEQSHRNAIAEIINCELNYIVCDEAKYFRFRKGANQQLDILAPPINELKTQGDRVKIVSSKLHGRLTKEACFIEEDLRTISLSDILPDDERACNLNVQVPSPSNLLILKLFAFDDRDEGQRQNAIRAQTHAWDIYIIMQTNRNDYLEGQKFLSRHSDSDIIQHAQSIVANKFSAVHQAGWQRVLEASDFYPNLNRQEKESKLDAAGRRLARWFNVPY